MPSQHLGLSCALSTPFTPDARVDTTRLVAHATWCLTQGCDGVTLFGTTGEGAAVAVADRVRAVDALLQSGIAPSRLLSGVTACAQEDAVVQARVAVEARLHGLLLTPPFYFRDATDDGLFAWFAGVLAAIGRTNVYLYHIPSITGVPLSVELIGRLKTAFPGVVVGVKDSSGEWRNTEKLLAAHSDLQILVGDERQLARAVRQGGAGTICGLANFVPALVRKAARDGIDDPRIAAIVEAVVRYPVMAAVKTLVAQQHGDAGWRVMAPPLAPLADGDAKSLVAELEKALTAKAA